MQIFLARATVITYNYEYGDDIYPDYPVKSHDMRLVQANTYDEAYDKYEAFLKGNNPDSKIEDIIISETLV